MPNSIPHRYMFATLFAAAVLLTGILCGSPCAAAPAATTAAIALVLQPGQTIQLVPMGMAPPIIWTIKEGATGGTITTSGKYVAPAKTGTYRIVGYSNSNPNKPCVFTVTVKAAATAITPPTTTPVTPVEIPFGTERLYPLPGGGGVLRMRYVPAGAFDMGNSERGDDAAMGTDEERPQHTVTLAGFWIGKTELTRGKYRLFIKAGGYAKREYWSDAGWAWRTDQGRVQPDNWEVDAQWAEPPGVFQQTEDHPVIGVNYFEAEAFCRWAGLRLPTEAEWEKAARWDGQRSRIYPWGDSWDSSSCNDAYDELYPGAQTAPIGKYPQGASACGALDMAGNAWEWASDWFGGDYYATSPSTDPQGADESDRRVIKGGSWFGSNFVGAGEDDRLRSALRTGFEPFNSDGRIGFRCAVTTMPASAQ